MLPEWLADVAARQHKAEVRARRKANKTCDAQAVTPAAAAADVTPALDVTKMDIIPATADAPGVPISLTSVSKSPPTRGRSCSTRSDQGHDSSILTLTPIPSHTTM